MKQVPADYPQILGATVQYLVATATWHQGLVYCQFQNSYFVSSFNLSLDIYIPRTTCCKITTTIAAVEPKQFIAQGIGLNTAVFRRVRKFAKSDYYLRHVCSSVGLHGILGSPWTDFN